MRKLSTNVKKIGQYQLTQQIGRGAFSKVYRAISQQNSLQYAVKMISKSELQSDKIEAIEEQIKILMQLSNPNIIRLTDFKKTQNNWYLVFDFCELGDLQNYMKKCKNGKFGENLTKKIVKQLISAFQEMKQYKIVHRDLKLANILINQDFIVKLGDFGFAQSLGETSSLMESYCGSPITMAPQILLHEQYNETCDIWSLGIIIYQMIFGVPPFNPKRGAHINDLIDLIKEHQINFDTAPGDTPISDDAKDLINQMLVLNKDERLNFDGLFSHPWILNIDQAQEESDTESISVDQDSYQDVLKSIYLDRKSVKKSSINLEIQQEIQKKPSLEEEKQEEKSPQNFIESKVQGKCDISEIIYFLKRKVRIKLNSEVDRYVLKLKEISLIINKLEKHVSMQGAKECIVLATTYWMRKIKNLNDAEFTIIFDFNQENQQFKKQMKIEKLHSRSILDMGRKEGGQIEKYTKEISSEQKFQSLSLTVMLISNLLNFCEQILFNESFDENQDSLLEEMEISLGLSNMILEGDQDQLENFIVKLASDSSQEFQDVINELQTHGSSKIDEMIKSDIDDVQQNPNFEDYSVKYGQLFSIQRVQNESPLEYSVMQAEEQRSLKTLYTMINNKYQSLKQS